MRAPTALRAVGGLLFPTAVALAVAALLARLGGEPVGGGLLALAAAVLALGMLAAAALATVAVLRRQWWWAGGLLVLWPVAIPLYLRHLRGDGAGGGDRSEDPEV